MSDLISRADAIEAVREVVIDNDAVEALKALPSANIIEFDFTKHQPRVRNKVNDSLPSAEQVTSKLKNPCDSLLTDDKDDSKEQKSKLDLISRADAVKFLQKFLDGLCTPLDDDDYCKGFDSGVRHCMNLLDLVPSVSADIQTEDFSDLPDIPRAYYEKIVGNMSHEINMLKQQLEDRPMVHSERPAEWIYEKLVMPLSNHTKECYRCSSCHTHWDYKTNYCPYCGAYMKGGAK